VLRHIQEQILSEKDIRNYTKRLPIPTRLIDDYIRQMQIRLREKKIGYEK
jgi:hypothetical protein